MCSANYITSDSDRTVADETVYSKVFEVLLMQSIASLYPASENLHPNKTFSDYPSTHNRHVTIEEVYDDKGVSPHYVLTSQAHILEEIQEDLRAELDPSINISIH